MACTVSVPTFSAAPSSSALFQTLAPSPAPTPLPREIAVFGAEDAKSFWQGVQAAAKDSGIEVVMIEGDTSAIATYVPQGDAAVIVYLSGDTQTLPSANIPVYAYASAGQSVSGGVPYLGYDATNEAQIALESAIAYPPHLAPVRMIGLFSGEGSAAFTAWSSAKASGQVFAKREFFADQPDVVLTDWLNDAFSQLYPGMLDAVYAETGELAIAATQTLASLGRDDLEVFCAGDGAQLTGKLSPILVCVAGANEQEAGARCFAEAKLLLEGGIAQSGILLPEAILYSPNP